MLRTCCLGQRPIVFARVLGFVSGFGFMFLISTVRGLGREGCHTFATLSSRRWCSTVEFLYWFWFLGGYSLGITCIGSSAWVLSRRPCQNSGSRVRVADPSVKQLVHTCVVQSLRFQVSGLQLRDWSWKCNTGLCLWLVNVLCCYCRKNAIWGTILVKCYQGLQLSGFIHINFSFCFCVVGFVWSRFEVI